MWNSKKEFRDHASCIKSARYVDYSSCVFWAGEQVQRLREAGAEDGGWNLRLRGALHLLTIPYREKITFSSSI